MQRSGDLTDCVSCSANIVSCALLEVHRLSLMEYCNLNALTEL